MSGDAPRSHALRDRFLRFLHTGTLWDRPSSASPHTMPPPRSARLILVLVILCDFAAVHGVPAAAPRALNTPAVLRGGLRPITLRRSLALPHRVEASALPHRAQRALDADFEWDPRGNPNAARSTVSILPFAAAAAVASVFTGLLFPALRPLLAGSIAGAVGVGVAYPFDCITTKLQAAAAKGEGSQGLVGMFHTVFRDQHLGGFYQGVKGAMMGQAVIKAVAFASNQWALAAALGGAPAPTVWQRIGCAMFAGLVTSFFVNPIERVKVVMQAGSVGDSNEVEAVKQLAAEDGLRGLLFRGLTATLAREIPAYALYFVVYGVLLTQWQALAVTGALAGLGPLVCGGVAGMAAWLPVYPIDVVKTEMQNTLSGAAEARPSVAGTAARLYRTKGVGVFFKGLDSKLLRACVNHAVAFFVFDSLMSAL